MTIAAGAETLVGPSGLVSTPMKLRSMKRMLEDTTKEPNKSSRYATRATTRAITVEEEVDHAVDPRKGNSSNININEGRVMLQKALELLGEYRAEFQGLRETRKTVNPGHGAARDDGGIASEQFGINKDGFRFVFTILGFFWMSEEGLGFDPTIRTANHEKFIEIERNGSKQRVIIDGIMLRARCIFGRATTCWRAHPEGHPETLLVMKDPWQYPERDEEGELLPEVTDKGVVNVARYYYHETVRVRGIDDDIRNNVRQGLDMATALNYRPGRPAQFGNMTAEGPPKLGATLSWT
ncbi:hypothetical protein EDB81DRAFT_951695 [Dactylonectria macrodidyma]|uniref:Fungal-type protein kinase domain-containing protein n=1 Tax=Dactylonectria macrodidyma TaxID=307937 RepID=A0A9P9DUF2_9HYPO|nr:hypothetical protein EDB81DRAFT_951695 [Dactylonectria macrodidyma]